MKFHEYPDQHYGESSLFTNLERTITAVELMTAKDRSPKTLVKELSLLQASYDRELALAIINKSLSRHSLSNLQRARTLINESKLLLSKQFESSAPEVGKADETVFNQLSLTAHRLLFLSSSVGFEQILKPCILKRSNNSCLYFLPDIGNELLLEVFSLAPNFQILGFEICEIKDDHRVNLYCQVNQEEIKTLQVKITGLDKKALADKKKKNRILIAVEGDIAGHAIRALETAKGLQSLGYDPTIFGDGYYINFFSQAGLTCLPYFTSKQNEERERIIARARGEKGGGIFFWNFKTVKERVEKTEESLTTYVEKGVDLFLSDMNPIADIAVQHLQQKLGKRFPCLSQTHDISLSGERPLKSVKVAGVPIGRAFAYLENSSFLDGVDSLKIRKNFRHFLFNQIANVFMGLPLLINDHTIHHSEAGNQGKRVKFTDYLYGRDGTLLFSLGKSHSSSGHYNVGLLAEKESHTESEDVQKKIAIPSDRQFVLNAQGSTYHKEAWTRVVSAISHSPNFFGIHSTGKKEDGESPIQIGDGKKRITIGYIVGYVAGYHFSKRADLVIHHGGYGTISQWILATAERINEDSQTLDRLIVESPIEEIKEFLSSCKNPSRSIAICNTFEQENNAQLLREMGGDNVCRVITADEVVESSNPEKYIAELATSTLEEPITKKELNFWLDTAQKVSQMNAQMHAALVLERILFNSKYAQ